MSNKIKLNVRSTEFFDETCIIDIVYNGKVVSSEVELLAEDTTLIYDVDDIVEFNSIKIDVLNSFVFISDYQAICEERTPNFGQENKVANHGPFDLNKDALGVALIISSVEVSTDDGETWRDITPGTESNPRFIASISEDGSIVDTYPSGRNSWKSMLTTPIFDRDTALIVLTDSETIYFTSDPTKISVNEKEFPADKVSVLHETSLSLGLPGEYVYTIPAELYNNLVTNS